MAPDRNAIVIHAALNYLFRQFYILILYCNRIDKIDIFFPTKIPIFNVPKTYML